MPLVRPFEGSLTRGYPSIGNIVYRLSWLGQLQVVFSQCLYAVFGCPH